MDYATLEAAVDNRPPRLVVYGTHGIGKSTFGASAPNPVFMKIEDGLAGLNVKQNKVSSYKEAIGMIQDLASQDHGLETLVIDSGDWLETLIHTHVCETWKDKKVSSIEEIGYGKGYVAALDFWHEFLQGLDYLRDTKNMTIIMIAHEKIKRFDDPMGAGYDRYMLKLHDRASSLVQEWADGVLFMKEKVLVSTEKSGVKKETTKGKSFGTVYMHTRETAAYQAKNKASLSLPQEFIVTKENGWNDFLANIGKNF